MSITIKKIAKICGTSRGTVDRVVNDRGGVNDELREKIKKVIAEYDYIPNKNARALVNMKHKYKIGVVINSIGNVFFDEVLKGIEDASKKVRSSGIEVEIIKIKGYSTKEQVNAIDMLVKKGVHALAITPIRGEEISNRISELKKKNIPTVLINADLDNCERLAVVSSNNTKSGEIAANIASLILQKGGKVAVITGSFNNLGHCKRVSGFKNVITNSSSGIDIVAIEENDDDDLKSKQVVGDILKRFPDINLIYFSAGGVSGGAEAMIDSKLDVHAITMDESETVKIHINDGLFYATITQQPYEQGYKPISILANYLTFGTLPEKSKIHTESKIKVKYSGF